MPSSRSLALLFAAGLLFGAGITPAAAETLDDFLLPSCGVDAAPPPIDYLGQTYGAEIVARASAFQVLGETPENDTLLWYLGTLRTPDARVVAREIVTTGLERFRYRVLGGVVQRPDWNGIELLVMGCGDESAVVRDSATSLLTAVNFNDPALADPNAASLRESIIRDLEALIASEADARLRGAMQDGLALIRSTRLAG